MALEKSTVIDKIEIDDQGRVFARRATVVLEDGAPISAPRYHRVSYEPTADISGEDIRIQDFALLARAKGAKLLAIQAVLRQ